MPKKQSKASKAGGDNFPETETKTAEEEYPADIWGADYDPSHADHPYGPVSSFMERLHKNELDRVVFSLISGFDVNDDRQHIPDVKFDMSPLHFGIAGSEAHGINHGSRAEILKVFMNHPQLNPNVGYTKWDGQGNFTRESPLFAAVKRLRAAKKTVKTGVLKDPRFHTNWLDACEIVEELAQHPDIDVGFGNHERKIKRTATGLVKTDTWTSPLEELLDSNSKALDCALKLMLAGAKETPKVRELLNKQIEEIDKAAIKGKDNPANRMKVFRPPGEEFEVDDDYTEIYIPDGLQCRWDLSSSTCAARIRAHWALWSKEIGWRPESHPYYPVPFRDGAKALMSCMLKMKRYKRSNSECSKAAESLRQELVDLDLEAEKFASLDERDFLVEMSFSDAAKLFDAFKAHYREKPVGLTIDNCKIVKDGMHLNCMPLNIQLGTPAEAGGGVRIECMGEKGLKMVDVQTGLSLREWSWQTKNDKDEYVGNIKWVDVVDGRYNTRTVKKEQHVYSMADASPDELCTFRLRIEDDPGLPMATKKDLFGRTSKCQAGCWRFYVPPTSTTDDLLKQASKLGYGSGGAKMADAIVNEDNDKWIEALSLRLKLVKEDLKAAKERHAGSAELEKLQEKVDYETQKRFVYEFRTELRKLEIQEEENRDEDEILKEANQIQAEAEKIDPNDEELGEKRDELMREAEAKRAEYRREVIKQARNFRIGAMKEADDLWKDAFEAQVKRLERNCEDVHAKGTRERSLKKQERLYSKAKALRQTSDENMSNFFALTYKKHISECAKQAADTEKAGDKQQAIELWREHRGMIGAFWKKYMSTSPNKSPTFFFIRLLYNLHFKRQIAEDDQLVEEKMKEIAELGKMLSKLNEKADNLEDALEKAEAAYKAAKDPLEEDWKAEGRPGEFLTWVQNLGEGEEWAELKGALDAKEENAAAFKEAKQLESETEADFNSAVSETSKLRKEGVDEAWTLWAQAFRPSFTILRKEAKKAFGLSEAALAESEPQGRKRSEKKRAADAKAYAMREAKRAALLHTQAEDLAACFWHVALRRKVESIEATFELAEKLREEDDARSDDEDEKAQQSGSGDKPPEEDMGALEMSAMKEKTKIVKEFYDGVLHYLMDDLMSRERKIDPNQTSDDGDDAKGDRAELQKHATLYRMQAVGLLSGFLHVTCGGHFRRLLVDQRLFEKWAARQEKRASPLQKFQLLAEQAKMYADWRVVRGMPVEGKAGDRGEEFSTPVMAAEEYLKSIVGDKMMKWIMMAEVEKCEAHSKKAVADYMKEKKKIEKLLDKTSGKYEPIQLAMPKEFAKLADEAETEGDAATADKWRAKGKEMAKLKNFNRIISDAQTKLLKKGKECERLMKQLVRLENETLPPFLGAPSPRKNAQGKAIRSDAERRMAVAELGQFFTVARAGGDAASSPTKKSKSKSKDLTKNVPKSSRMQELRVQWKQLDDFYQELLPLRSRLQDRKKVALKCLEKAKKLVHNMVTAVVENDPKKTYNSIMSAINSEYTKVQAQIEDTSGAANLAGKSSALEKQMEDVKLFNDSVSSKETLWKENKKSMGVSLPAAPGLVGDGLFYRFDERIAKFYVDEISKEAEKSSDPLSEGVASKSGEKESFESRFPIRMAAFGSRSEEGKSARLSEGISLEDPCGWLPNEFEIAVGKQGVCLRKKQDGRHVDANDEVDGSNPIVDPERDLVIEERDVLMFWPWWAISKLEAVGNDKNVLQVCIGGTPPPAPRNVNLTALPDFIKVTWSAQFQGSPCQFDRGANAVHPLPVTQYRVERSGADGKTEERYCTTVEGIAPDVTNWRGTEDFRWAENRARPQGLTPLVKYKFRVSARNAVGWGPYSEWSEKTDLLELFELEIERYWFGGLNLPLRVTARILSFLKYDAFPTGRSGPHLVHGQNGRLATIEEVKLRLYRTFFDKMKGNYHAMGGHDATHQIQMAKAEAIARERSLAKSQADEWLLEREKERRTLLLIETNEKQSSSQSLPSTNQLTQPQSQTHRRRLVKGPGIMAKMGGGKTSARKEVLSFYTPEALAYDPAKEMAPEKPRPSNASGLWSMLGPNFFKTTGQWRGFNKPPLAGKIGDTLFVRVNTSSKHAVKCGRTPLHLTHDDENWAPVVLQGKHNDGTVDYEMKYITDSDGDGQSWFLSQEPVLPTYDPIRKCEIWFPVLFTEDQLQIWRQCRWERITAQEGIRKRNLTSKFPPGTLVEVEVTYPIANVWQGLVLAVNEDSTYFVTNDATNGLAIPETMMRRLHLDEVTEELRKKVATALNRRGSTDHQAKRSPRASGGDMVSFGGASGGKKQKTPRGALGSFELGEIGSPPGAFGERTSTGRRAGTYTALHYAAGECEVEVLQAMMNDHNERTEVDLQDACGCTPLHWAASTGRIENVQLLLEYGASEKTKNYMGYTALEWTKFRNKSRIADQLREIALEESNKFHRDSGACADKINVITLMQVVELLSERASRPTAGVNMVKMRRYMRHARLSGMPLTAFATTLAKYDIHTLVPKEQNDFRKTPMIMSEADSSTMKWCEGDITSPTKAGLRAPKRLGAALSSEV